MQLISEEKYEQAGKKVEKSRWRKIAISKILLVTAVYGMTQVYPVFKELSDGLWRSSWQPLIKRLRIITKEPFDVDLITFAF